MEQMELPVFHQLQDARRAVEQVAELEGIKYRSSENYPAENETSTFRYIPLDLPERYEPTMVDAWNRLAIARCIPQDGRIQLPFDFHWQAQKDEVLFPNADHLTKKAVQNVESLADVFDPDFIDLGEFVIRDVDPSNPPVYVWYDLGSELPCVTLPNVDPQKMERIYDIQDHEQISRWQHDQKVFCEDHQQRKGIAPWQRVILCQGLQFASPPHTPEFKRNFPFLVFDEMDDPIRLAINTHMSMKRRGGSETTNPYSNPNHAFHITFYERIFEQNRNKLVDESHKRNLKIGRLYDKPLKGGHYRQSSLTIIVTARYITNRLYSDHYWTMLVLSPSGFFPSVSQQSQEFDWVRFGYRSNRHAAELTCIVSALGIVEKRWEQFNDYFESLLVEDFMDPDAYVKLLFDDDRFSRSRLYFWIIGCLNEFIVSIEDNIKQCDLLRKARKYPHDPKSSDLYGLRELDKKAADIQQSLEDLRAQFKAKLETVGALRDGLFNASALMESRSSTRLGQNVQLLTYVSIFYLPLAFCAALWAIPNINEGGTKNAFIITAIIVGFITYAIVFNLENFAGVFGRSYASRRERLLQEMGNDRDGDWQELRQKFDDFPSNRERTTPSEWWIIRYQICRWLRVGRVKATKDDEGTA